MSNKFLLAIFIVIGLFACKNEPRQTSLTYVALQGETMGTYYRVTYGDSLARNFQEDIEALLKAFNDEVSTYIPTSTISQFNQANSELDVTGKQYFLGNFRKSREVFEKSGGAFDPTVMPLVNYWGFGYTPKKPVTQVDSAAVDSLLQFVGMGNVELVQENGRDILKKTKPGVQLDYSAIAKGYAIDEVAKLLESKGVQNYLVDIGGEARAKGINSKGVDWTVGINVPKEEAGLHDIEAAVSLHNRSIATSGNYRNFYEVNGVKYGHEIDPKTGFPERTSLLSASAFADDCATADAWATAFMVMGLDKAYEMATRLPEIEAYFIYGDPNGNMDVKYTEELKSLFEKNKE